MMPDPAPGPPAALPAGRRATAVPGFPGPSRAGRSVIADRPARVLPGASGHMSGSHTTKETLMEISGLLTAILIGIVIGVLGRLALPGRQRIGVIWTILVGVLAALLGTAIAAAVGVADTDGVDWIELALQVALAAGGVAAVERFKGGR